MAAKSCAAEVELGSMPAVRPQSKAAMSSPIFSSERQARAVRAAFACCPSLNQQRAQERDRCPSNIALHSPRVVSGLNQEKTAEASARPSQRRAKVWRVATPGNVSAATRRGFRHHLAVAALIPSPFSAFPAAHRMPQYLDPSPGLLGGGERPGRKVCARNAIPSISAGMVGARAQDLDSRTDSARTVSLSNRRPSHRPAPAREAAAWFARKKQKSVEICSLGQNEWFAIFGSIRRTFLVSSVVLGVLFTCDCSISNFLVFHVLFCPGFASSRPGVASKFASKLKKESCRHWSHFSKSGGQLM